VEYAVGFARPDTWKQAPWVDADRPWHAVEAIRPPAELDGEVELAVCGAIVQVWGRQEWDRLAIGRGGCAECLRLTTAEPGDAAPADVGPAEVQPPPAEQPAERHLRVVS
jgi:hypothetical protein